MTIKGIETNIQGIQDLIPKPTTPTGPGQIEGKEGFGSMLKSAITEVDELQKVAEDHIDGFITGKEGYTTHATMIAIEKADISFQLMNTIRGKIIRAYEEVLRTQI